MNYCMIMVVISLRVRRRINETLNILSLISELVVVRNEQLVGGCLKRIDIGDNALIDSFAEYVFAWLLTQLTLQFRACVLEPPCLVGHLHRMATLAAANQFRQQ